MKNKYSFKPGDEDLVYIFESRYQGLKSSVRNVLMHAYHFEFIGFVLLSFILPSQVYQIHPLGSTLCSLLTFFALCMINNKSKKGMGRRFPFLLGKVSARAPYEKNAEYFNFMTYLRAAGFMRVYIISTLLLVAPIVSIISFAFFVPSDNVLSYSLSYPAITVGYILIITYMFAVWLVNKEVIATAGRALDDFLLARNDLELYIGEAGPIREVLQADTDF